MKIDKPSAILAYVGWLSVFVLGWLMVLRTIPADKLTWTFFAIFFVVAVFASAVSSEKPKKDGVISPDDMVVKWDDKIYTQSNGGLVIGPERPDGKVIVIVQKQPDHPLDLPQPSRNIGNEKKTKELA